MSNLKLNGGWRVQKNIFRDFNDEAIMQLSLLMLETGMEKTSPHFEKTESHSSTTDEEHS